MAIDPKININENQVIFKGSGGHAHNGLTSSLIDYTKYSIFDFVTYPIAPLGTARRNLEEANSNNLKSFIVNTIEQRVLNPQGIRIQANAITAREIVSGTITANELASNVILVNNVIKSKDYNGTVDVNGDITAYGNTGWAITHSGASEFNDVFVRGGIAANTGTIGNILITSSTVQSSDYDGSNGFALYSNGFADFNEVSVRGEIVALSGSISDNFSIGSNVQIGGFANIGANVSIGANASIGASATIGGSLKIGNNVRINDASEDGGLTTFKVKGETATAGKWIARFQKSTNAYVLTIENDGSVDVTGTLKVNGASVTTGGPYLPTSGGTLSGDLTVNSQVFISASLGTTETDPALRVNRSYDADGGYFIEFTNTGGTVQAGKIRYVVGSSTSVTYLTTSDGRLKTKIEKDLNSINIIKQLNPTYYKWKNSNSEHYGFIAQELYSVIPSAASKGDEDEPFLTEEGFLNVKEPWSVDLSGIVPYLVKAMQELVDKNEVLEARLQALEGV